VIILIILATLLPLLTFAQTDFEGEVSGEWVIDDSPYIQVGAASVPADETLEIMPGVTVVLHEEEAFFIAGVIQAVGEEDNRITFASPEDVMASGIRIESEAEEACTFNYCDFSVLVYGIHSFYSSLEVEDCRFTNCRLSLACYDGEANINNCFSTAEEEGFGQMDFGGDDGHGRFTLTSTVIEGDNHISFSNIEHATINDCNFTEIRASFNDEIFLTNSTVGNANLHYSSGIVSQNNIGGLTHEGSHFDITDNSIGSVNLSSFTGRIENNTIRGMLSVQHGSEVDFIDNSVGPINIGPNSEANIVRNTVNGKLEIRNSNVLGDRRGR